MNREVRSGEAVVDNTNLKFAVFVLFNLQMSRDRSILYEYIFDNLVKI
jgi:hypothetical protein